MNAFLKFYLVPKYLTACLFAAVFLVLLFTDKSPVYNYFTISDECRDIKVHPENKIYEKIGVQECCFALAVIVHAEGYYSGNLPPECSGKEMDKIYKFCENNDSCW